MPNFSVNAVLCQSCAYCLWLASLNIALIIIVNPCIVNPGPSTNPSVLYQNVRGFVPWYDLGERFPKLDVTKILEFQAWIFEAKPDVVILNETFS